MKKKDIIKLVKESVQEVKSDAYGDATLTSQGQSIHRAPGVWEFKQPKSFFLAIGAKLSNKDCKADLS